MQERETDVSELSGREYDERIKIPYATAFLVLKVNTSNATVWWGTCSKNNGNDNNNLLICIFRTSRSSSRKNCSILEQFRFCAYSE